MVRHHSVVVPIYTSIIHGKTRSTIAFYLDGRRRRRCFTDLGEAKKEAKLGIKFPAVEFSCVASRS